MALRGRKGVVLSLAQSQRDIDRHQAAQIRAHKATVQEDERARKAYERAVKQAQQAVLHKAKELKRLELEARAAQVDVMNAEIAEAVDALGTVLEATLAVDDYIDFDRLKRRPQTPVFDPGGLGAVEPPPDWTRFDPPQAAGIGLLTGQRKRAMIEARASFDRATLEHQQRERARLTRLEDYRNEFARWLERRRREDETYNATVDHFRSRFDSGEPEAERRRIKRHLGNDVRLRPSLIRVRQQQAHRAAEWRKLALPVGGARRREGQDRATGGLGGSGALVLALRPADRLPRLRLLSRR